MHNVIIETCSKDLDDVYIAGVWLVYGWYMDGIWMYMGGKWQYMAVYGGIWWYMVVYGRYMGGIWAVYGGIWWYMGGIWVVYGWYMVYPLVIFR